MQSILGPYLSYHHWWQSTEDYLRQLDPAWARIHQPTAKGIFVTQKNAPNANIMLRSWDIDDHNGDRKRELYADPKGAARFHLQMWKQKWQELESELKRNGWAYNTNRWYLGLVNEPDPAYAPQVVEYSLEAMRLVKGTQIRLGVVVSSVGTFSKPSENNRGWSLFKPLEQLINDGGHILVVHEYWQPEGPSFGEDAGNLAWRHKHIPLNVPILIGESGANGYIYQRYSNTDDAGWGKFMDAAKFAAQTKEYIEGCDERVKGVLLYMEDYHSDQWRTFDTSGAHNELLAIKDVRPSKPNPFAGATTRLPSIGAGPTQPQPQPTVPTAPPQDSLTPSPVAGQARLIWPVKGVITQRWGERADFYQQKLGIPYHNGTDIGAAAGSPVVAMADGKVVFVGNDPAGYGNYVRVFCPAYAFHFFVAHMQSVSVVPGQTVKQGQTLGTVGSTGMSSGPHAHVEIRLGTEAGYSQGTYGHSNGRVDPSIVHWLLNREAA